MGGAVFGAMNAEVSHVNQGCCLTQKMSKMQSLDSSKCTDRAKRRCGQL